MSTEVNLLDRYPRSDRPVKERAGAKTPEQMRVARQFGRDYFDGDRLFGYGGYHYHPRFWTDTVKRFKGHYHLAENASVLDVGCGKGFMMRDFKTLMPGMTVAGLDISSYAFEHALEDMKPFIKIGNAKKLPYPDHSFDLVISIHTIHNLPPDECGQALREIQRVTKKNAFVAVDAWRTEEEKARLLQWNLTALTYMHVNEWKKFFEDAGYQGDYYWFIP
ncbi:MAG: class I SAM-dependent methyltransferase [Candidatus Omnitrophica bacterium]|nr:class I SAM-dependent methyltransferase [Candidatus Omnitrophota bacterium]